MMPFSSPWIRAAFGLLAAVLFTVGVVYLVFLREKPQPAPRAEPQVTEPSRAVIGTSVDGRPLEVYTFGSGEQQVLFVGGIHGGYEWNSVLLAYEFLDYVEAHPEFVPAHMTVSVIPSANPDGLYAVIKKEGRFTEDDVPPGGKEAAAPGRFNANEVDLNRNFDCKWKPTSTWQSRVVSAGGAPFSEPEARALRDYILTETPDAVVFWHSQANAVYASECTEGILSATRDIMGAYAKAAGYPAVDSFTAYEITGDAEGWLASVGIPAITVELSSHDAVEWERNRAGVAALFDYYRTIAR